MATAFAASSSLAAAKLAPVSQVQAAGARKAIAGRPVVPRFNVGKAGRVQASLDNEKAQVLAGTVLAGSLFSALTNAPSAMAAQEVMQLAADARPVVLVLPLAAAIGWVLFNILQPALNQLNKMTGAKRSVIGALGLGAAGSLLLAPQADAAQEVMQLAADARPALFALPLVAALGWVAFNIAQPGLNQLKRMTGAKGMIGAVGLGAASLVAADQADAAQEVMQLAADARPLVLLLPLAAALGWVLFNILGPALNQLKKMLGQSTGGATGTQRRRK